MRQNRQRNRRDKAEAGHTEGRVTLMHDAAARFGLHVRGVTGRPILDVHVVDHCNLNCASCNHFAPIAEERFLALDDYEHDLKLLARIKGADSFFDAIYLMGGEPLLHPQIADIVLITRRHFPMTKLYVSTNGLMLASMPSGFWLACKQAHAAVLLTRYPVDVDYDGLLDLAERHGVCAQAQSEVVAGRQSFCFRRTPMDPSGAHDPALNYTHCPSGGYCLQLRDGRIYPCHRSAYMDALNTRFATSFSHDADDYLELAALSDLDEIDAFRRTPKPVCRYCAFDEIEVLPWAQSQGSRNEWLVGSGEDSQHGQSGLSLFDERISWKVPTLFNNDWVALAMAQELNPLLSKPLFADAYGCVSCAWAGGRYAPMEQLPEAELRRYFVAYAEAGSTCSLTLSRPDAGDFLDDAYGNLLLDLLQEFGGSAIVVDERLARHIRKTHPDVNLVASYNRVLIDHGKNFDGMDEERYYRALLNLYDEVVVRCEALLEGGIAEQLVDVADRVQLIVNQQCVRDCPVAVEHILGIEKASRAKEAGERFELPSCTQRRDGTGETVQVQPERRLELIDMGFTKFKLQGRNTQSHVAFMLLASNILGLHDAADAPEELRSIFVTARIMDALGTPVGLSTNIPASGNSLRNQVS